MTQNEIILLDYLKKGNFDYVYRNKKGQLFAVADYYKVLLDSDCFKSITIPCPIYQLEQIYNYGIHDKDNIIVWIMLLENGKTDVLLRILKEKLKE